VSLITTKSPNQIIKQRQRERRGQGQVMQCLAWRVAAIQATEMQAHLSKLVPWRYHENREPKNIEMKQAREPHKY